MDVFRPDCPTIEHLLTLLDENQTIGKHHKKYEQIEICKEFANYFVKLIKIKRKSIYFGYFSHILFCIFDSCTSGHSDDIPLFVVVYFLKKQQV